jgi:S-formylglutathione hydrolase FrmB
MSPGGMALRAAAIRPGRRNLRGVILAAGVFLPLFSLRASLPAEPLRREVIAPRIEEVAFASAALGREMKFVVVHPAVERVAAAERPVLFLLHGRGRHRRSLIDLPETRECLLAAECWIVLPDGEDGWYINSPVESPARYGDYLEEVVRLATHTYRFSLDASQRAIAGWSMGGYGAFRFAEAHPHDFGTVAGIIGVLDFPRAETLPAGQNYRVPVARFGSDPTVWSELNPRDHVAALRGKAILLITARESFDRTMNENFSAALTAAGIVHEFRLQTGGHTLDVVQAALPAVLEFVRRNTNSQSTPTPPK